MCGGATLSTPRPGRLESAGSKRASARRHPTPCPRARSRPRRLALEVEVKRLQEDEREAMPLDGDRGWRRRLTAVLTPPPDHWQASRRGVDSLVRLAGVCDPRIRSRGAVMSRPSDLLAHFRVTARIASRFLRDHSRHRRTQPTSAHSKSHRCPGRSAQDSARTNGLRRAPPESCLARRRTAIVSRRIALARQKRSVIPAITAKAGVPPRNRRQVHAWPSSSPGGRGTANCGRRARWPSGFSKR